MVHLAGWPWDTPWLMLSDLHLDEVVAPAEIGYANAYNRKIAERRLQATFTKKGSKALAFLNCIC